MLLWAENALAHGGEFLVVFVAALAIPLAILAVFLTRWHASAPQKAIVVLAYFGSYPVLFLVSPAIGQVLSVAPTWLQFAIPIGLIGLPLVFSLAVAWALGAKPDRRLDSDAPPAKPSV